MAQFRPQSREAWLAFLNACTLFALTLVVLAQPHVSWVGLAVVLIVAVVLLGMLLTFSRASATESRAISSLAEATAPHGTQSTALSAAAARAPASLAPADASVPLAPAADTSVNQSLSETVAALAATLTLARQCEQALREQSATFEHFATLRASVGQSSAFDPLTGVATHTTFMTRLTRDVEFSRKHGRSLAVALLDIVGFTAINVRYGYHIGDEVLAAVAERLRLAVDDRDLLGRLEGDRFAVVWANCDGNEALARLEHLLAAIMRAPLVHPALPAPLNVELQAGLALCPDDGVAAHALVDLAADALRQRHHSAELRRTNPLASTDSPYANASMPVAAPLPPTEHFGDPPFDADRLEQMGNDALLPRLTPNSEPEAPISYLQQLVERHSGINALTSALEARDPLSTAHGRYLAELAEETALFLGRPIEEARLVGLAVLLHDVGELGISPEILQKADPLTPEEWHFVREHPRLGERLLKSVGGVLAAVAPMVASHRERWDGSGYPEQLSGEGIPLGARIVAICDVYGALVSERPYRAAFSMEVAAAEIERGAGTQFDPQVVAAFLHALQA